ncbi:hypothetical protein BC829DRAFT_252303 [Chytridium lagenaria]|nr:hypothetical protein BC829DRAFT_252303 [Chytridium lagenaria]
MTPQNPQSLHHLLTKTALNSILASSPTKLPQAQFQSSEALTNPVKTIPSLRTSLPRQHCITQRHKHRGRHVKGHKTTASTTYLQKPPPARATTKEPSESSSHTKDVSRSSNTTSSPTRLSQTASTPPRKFNNPKNRIFPTEIKSIQTPVLQPSQIPLKRRKRQRYH